MTLEILNCREPSRAKTQPPLPERFAVYSSVSQKIFGVLRILIGGYLSVISFLVLISSFGDQRSGEFFSVFLFFALMFAGGLYFAYIGLRFDIGRTITVEGGQLKVGRMSCSLDCIARVECLEEREKRGWGEALFRRFRKPRYIVYDCWGNIVCCCRENYVNFSLLHRWLLKKPSVTNI